MRNMFLACGGIGIVMWQNLILRDDRSCRPGAALSRGSRTAGSEESAVSFDLYPVSAWFSNSLHRSSKESV